jgi:hypothetical protein
MMLIKMVARHKSTMDALELPSEGPRGKSGEAPDPGLHPYRFQTAERRLLQETFHMHRFAIDDFGFVAGGWTHEISLHKILRVRLEAPENKKSTIEKTHYSC